VDFALADYKFGFDMIGHFSPGFRENVGRRPLRQPDFTLRNDVFIADFKLFPIFAEHLPHSPNLNGIQISENWITESGIIRIAILHGFKVLFLKRTVKRVDQFFIFIHDDFNFGDVDVAENLGLKLDSWTPFIDGFPLADHPNPALWCTW
jgi:hypothetical protein